MLFLHLNQKQYHRQKNSSFKQPFCKRIHPVTSGKKLTYKRKPVKYIAENYGTGAVPVKHTDTQATMHVNPVLTLIMTGVSGRNDV